MNYILLENKIEESKIGKGKICQKIGITTQGFNAAIKNNTLKIKDLEGIAKILNLPVSLFLHEKIDEKIDRIYNVENKNSIIINTLEKEVENLKERIADKERILQEKERTIEILLKSEK